MISLILTSKSITITKLPNTVQNSFINYIKIHYIFQYLLEWSKTYIQMHCYFNQITHDKEEAQQFHKKEDNKVKKKKK